jgi:hypothetical protein
LNTPSRPKLLLAAAIAVLAPAVAGCSNQLLATIGTNPPTLSNPLAVPPPPSLPAPPPPPAPPPSPAPAPAPSGGSGGGGGGQPQGGGGGGSSPQPSPRQPPPPGPSPQRQGQSPAPAPATGYRSDGSPTPSNPTFFDALPGSLAPDFVIRQFSVPPFLLPIYQAAGTQYQIPWQVLAGINSIETDYGRNLSVSSAGAVGWMQFEPSTWQLYAVDGNQDGVKDPYNPVDAIFSAARYLKAAGGDTDIKKGVLAYNHAQWYVDEVMLRASVLGGMPPDLLSALTGLTEGRFPVYGHATYADDPAQRGQGMLARPGQSNVDQGSQQQALDIFSDQGAPAIATNDAQVQDVGQNPQLGRYVVLQDINGNHYTYGGLADVVHNYPAPADAPPAQGSPSQSDPRVMQKQRLFANPQRPNSFAAGGQEQLNDQTQKARADGFNSVSDYFPPNSQPPPQPLVMQPFVRGAHLLSGTIIGHLGKQDASAPHLHFQITPAGNGAPNIDPKPILDGWKLLEATSVYRSDGKNVLLAGDNADIGSILLLPKPQLEQRVLNDGRIDIYPCGRQDIQTGQIDQRVLAMLEYLSDSGLRPSVSALKCGHSLMTTSGNVSAHSVGAAADLATINGIPIEGHQGPGSITEITLRRLMLMQGSMAPDQLISLMSLGGPSFALPDHYNHIHVGYKPRFGDSQVDFGSVSPQQWNELMAQLGQIKNPQVSAQPSPQATPAGPATGEQ